MPAKSKKTPPSAAAAAQAPAEAHEAPNAGVDLAPQVGANLRRLRTKKGLSLEKLAQLCGVSRAMLGQIELGKSAPTINVLWKISAGLDVTFSSLITSHASSATTVLRAAHARRLTSADASFTSRALFPIDAPHRVEFYELTLAAHKQEVADAHPAGTRENLIVVTGRVDIEIQGEVTALGPGDAILFEADSPHVYRNSGDEPARMYLVMTYADSVG